MTGAPAMPAPKPYPLPADFPVTWPDPAMSFAPWQQDRMHMPDPATPMSSWLSLTFAKGFSKGLAAYSLPLGAATARINTYFYMAIAPVVPPEQIPEMEGKAEPLLMAGIGNFWQRWEAEWLPELKRGWDEWAAVDLRTLSDAELVVATEKYVNWYERIWQIHFELLIPALVGISSYQDIYKDLFPDAGPLDAYRLLQGFDCMSLEAGRKLWELSRAVKANSGLLGLFESTPASELAAKLEASEAGRAFLAEFNAFIAFYGRRSDGVQELAPPSWTEDPTPPLANLKAYVLQDSDPDVAHSRLVADRERLVAEARQAIAAYPAPVKGQFEVLLAAGAAASRVQEDHNFWIDQRGLHEFRQLCLEYGRRLVERNQLARPADILLLTMPVAQEFLANGADASTVAAEARDEMDRWAKVVPAPSIGMDYGPPPDNPVTRAISRFFGAPPPLSDKPVTDLRGYPGSPGVVRGTARVIRSISEGGRLQQGEILVAPTTAPPWTPLFATAGGIVTDTGGVLSHCAIVAREYGIPAAVGIYGATSAITDGMTIEVDGNEGVVRILS